MAGFMKCVTVKQRLFLREVVIWGTTKGDADLGRRFYFKRNPQLSDLDLLGTPVALKTFSG